MPQRVEIINKLKQSYKFLASEFSVDKIAIFGSVANDTMTSESDVDIVVEFSSPIGFRFNQLVEYLEDLLGNKVDILTREGIKNIRVKEVAENIEKSLTYV